MARKSRKASIQAVLGGAPLLVSESAAMRTAIWNTAGYARLSIMETRDRKDSEGSPPVGEPAEDTSIAIQEIIKEYQRQKTNQRSRKGGSARKPQQYHAEAEVII